jgi:hypothetical protein
MLCLSMGFGHVGAAMAAGTPVDGKVPYTGSQFDIYALSRPDVAYLVSYVGQEREGRINTDGSTDTNRGFVPGSTPLFVETQKIGYQVLRAGLAANNSLWIDKGLRAIEWGLKPEVLGADGSFPDQRETETLAGRALHPKSIFLDSAAHAVLLIRQSDAPAAYKARAELLVPGIHLAVREIVDSGDAIRFFKNNGNSSQLAFVAMAIHQAGLMSGDQSLIDYARANFEQIFSMQKADGAFLEKGGFDTSYQMNTLELTTAYNATLEPGEWRNRVAAQNKLATDWFLSRVAADGSINTRGNTRQKECSSLPGYFPKGLDIDNIPIRLYYHAYLAGRTKVVAPVAAQIQFRGTTYDHFGHCANPVVQ